jgi:malate-CoA ligase subunit alpha
MRLIGPNCAGVISPGESMMGIMPDHIYAKGRVGIVGRSGTLGYEAASQLKALGLGVSTSVGIGGDPINGSSFRDILELFENDPETDAVLMIGEIGGPQEAEAARYWAENMKKPLVAYVAGLSAPKGRKMGHAGAIISAFGESAQEKVDILSELGVAIAPNPSSMGETVADILPAHPRSLHSPQTHARDRGPRVRRDRADKRGAADAGEGGHAPCGRGFKFRGVHPMRVVEGLGLRRGLRRWPG